MYDQILVPTDGSTETSQAVKHGLGLAETYDATVHALSVVDTSEFGAITVEEERETLRRSAEKSSRQITEEISSEAERFDLRCERDVRFGRPSEAILDYVETHGIDLITMGTHGRSGVRSDLGSTTLRVVRGADVPVLTVRFLEGFHVDPGASSDVYDDILIATDGSDGAMAAVEHALDIADRYSATVHALYVIDTNTYAYGDVPRSIIGLLREGGEGALEAITEQAHVSGMEAETRILRGTPSREILGYADRNEVDLITMGAHGRTGETHLGSTTEQVVRNDERPTLTVW